MTEVTEADRVSAADLMLALFENSHGLEAEGEWSQTVRAGEDDAYPIVQAFARHRQTSTAALVEALGEVRDWIRYELEAGTPRASVILQRVDAAIKEGQP